MREEISLIEELDRGLERQDRLDVQLTRLEVALVEQKEAQGTDNLTDNLDTV